MTVTDERMTPLLHDDPGGGPADHPRGIARARAAARCSCSTWASRCRIIDLAETMISLSGLEPGRDIAIEIVGARPGEKFHEDLFNPYERLQPTPAQKILRAERDPLDPAWVEQMLRENQPARAGRRRGRARRTCGEARARPRRHSGGARRPDSLRRLRVAQHGVASVRSIHPPLHQLGGRRRRLRRDHRAGDPDPAVFRAGQRDLALRDHADEAAARIQQLEARLAQLSRAAAGARRRRRDRRSIVGAVAAGPIAARARWSPAAPAGVAAPALAAATRLIPTATPAASPTRRCGARRRRSRPQPRWR